MKSTNTHLFSTFFIELFNRISHFTKKKSLLYQNFVVMLAPVFLLLFLCAFQAPPPDGPEPPNIVFAFADDWGIHASIYGTPGIQTPTFDRVAEAGVRFDRAFMDAPSCTPARGAVLTGQHPWRLGPGASLHSELPAEIPVYPDLLGESGYFVGYTRKGWGPGNVEAGGRDRNPAGPVFDDFESFLEDRPEGQPFSFWFGSQDPHRSNRPGELHLEKGIDPNDVEVPAKYPDVPEVREDIAEYYAQVQRFDREVGELIEKLEEIGELENTLFVIGSDHGWPFPRGKSNLYDDGTHVPLAIWWPKRMDEMDTGGRIINDLVLKSDLAPTFLEAAGITPPREMTGRSLMPILDSAREDRVQGFRTYVLLVKERHHGLSREGGKGYPGRALRTEDYLLIRNFEPDRWPLGAPYISSSQGIFSDSDDGLTRQYLIDHANDPEVTPYFLRIFDKRPELELYDLRTDPDQFNNIAEEPEYRNVKNHLLNILESELRALEDPRIFGDGDKFDEYPYHVNYGKERVEPPPQLRQLLNLD
jgi:N-sulfoglucosamine sulfohydrolase